MSGPLFFDRVQETATVTGTSNPFTLTGAVPGFQQFSAVLSDGDTVYYAAAAVDGSGVPTGSWEEGVGTFSASGGTIARTTVMFSSNGNAAVNWVSGTKRIAIVAPAAMVAGCVLLAKLSASNSASLDFISRNANGLTGAIFQADFDVYQVDYFDLLAGTNAVDCWLRLSTNGGSSFDATAANYQWSGSYALANGTGGGFAGYNGLIAGMRVGIEQTRNSGNYKNSGYFTIFNPLGSGYKQVSGHFSGEDNRDSVPINMGYSGWYLNTTAVNAMRIVMSSGNIATGTVRVYGLRK